MYKYTTTGDYIIKKNVEKFTKETLVDRPQQKKPQIYGRNYNKIYNTLQQVREQNQDYNQNYNKLQQVREQNQDYNQNYNKLQPVQHYF